MDRQADATPSPATLATARAPASPDSTRVAGLLSLMPKPIMPRSPSATKTVVPRAEPMASEPETARPAPSRGDSASVDALRVRRMVTDYHTLTGENPVGTNAEIMAAVMGKNPRQATLGPPEGFSLNPQGELVDEWGTPYFFHQLSRDVMEIHSAGPDKIMGTADDIVVR